MIVYHFQVVFKVLREMAEVHEGASDFNFKHFEKKLAEESLDGKQRMMLNMRLDVLKSFLPPEPVKTYTTKVRTGWNASQVEKVDRLYGSPGELIIVDLTDPVLEPEIVCTLFDIALNQFVASTPGGKMVALDEAHNVCPS
jgi:hypothetical protein